MTSVLYEAVLSSGSHTYTVSKYIQEIYGESSSLNAFSNCKSGIWEVDFQSDSQLTTVQPYSFYGCYNLDHVYLNKCPHLTSIGEKAFYGCKSLDDITFPSSVTSIGESLFEECTYLKTVTLGGTFTSIPLNCFYNCEGMTSITLISTIQSIGDYAFKYCSVLASLDLPAALKTIGVDAFKGCYKLATCSIKEGLEYINFGAFTDCWALTKVYLPSTLINISSEAFYKCKSLTTVELAQQVKFPSYGEFCFYQAAITTIRIPASVKVISTSAFTETTKLASFSVDSGHTVFRTDDGVLFNGTELFHWPDGKSDSYTIPDNTQYIGEKAFNSSIIKTVVLPGKLKDIKVSAFSYCPNIVTFNFKQTTDGSVYDISKNAFIQCNLLKEITISKSVNCIRKFAFMYCYNLTTIHFEEGVKRIESNAFRSCESLNNVKLPDSIEFLGEEVFIYCSGLQNFEFSNNPKLTTLYKSLFDEANLTRIVVPEGITDINEFCFRDCAFLKEVILPQSINYLGSAIFSGCPEDIRVVFAKGGRYEVVDTYLLVDTWNDEAIQYFKRSATVVTLPSTLKKVGASVFCDFPNLTTIKFSDNNPQLETIEGYAFEDCIKLSSFATCPKLTTIKKCAFSGTALPTINFCPHLTTIADNGFSGCKSLVNISDLPDLTYIGSFTFYSCPSLTTIGQLNSLETISFDAFDGASALKSFPLCPKLSLIGDSAFERCGSLESFTFGEKITTIENEAFMRCEKLKSIEFKAAAGSSLTIGKGSFIYCQELTTITMDPHANLVNISKNAFAESGITQFHIPSSLKEIGENAFYGCNLTTITSETEGQLTEILPHCFENFVSLTSAALPNSVKIIGELAYSNTRITTFTLPKSTTEVGGLAFLDCKELINFIIPEGSQLEKVGYKLFFKCSKMVEIINHSPKFTIHETALFTIDKINLIVFPTASPQKDFHMPQETTYIYPYAFYGCENLITVLFKPNSIQVIDAFAFSECVHLTIINIPASVREIGDGAFLNCLKLMCGLEIEKRTDEIIDVLLNRANMIKTAVFPCPVSLNRYFLHIRMADVLLTGLLSFMIA